MKILFQSVYFLGVFVLASCSSPTKPGEAVKPVEKTDSCTLDPKNSYEIYIPGRLGLTGKLPLLVIIDAHGNGQFALEKFKSGADRYPIILVASNLIKNGYDNYAGAIQNLIEDVYQKYPVGKTVFLAGFSGGARMALGYALSHRINGLILCGALANADQINALSCPVYSISGMDDFNFMETAQYLFHDQSFPSMLKIELTHGSHDWPDSLTLSNALGFLYLSGQAPGSGLPEKSEVKAYCQLQHDRIDAMAKQGDLLDAALIARNLSVTPPFSKNKSFASTYNELKTYPEYISQMDQLQNCLNIETSARQPYLNAFKTKDSLWWQYEISTIDEKIKSEQDPLTTDMYQRIKSFWGIACYSLGNQAIKEHSAEKLNKIVTIYRMLEPDNPYVIYFSAFPYFWAGNDEATLLLLQKARDSGFSEMDQLKGAFPESITSKLN